MENYLFTILFIIFFGLSVLIWFKLFFEINKFKKIEKVRKDLDFLTSSFFLNKLIEIKNNENNQDTKLILKYFIKKYNILFNEKLESELRSFFLNNKSVEQLSEFLVETQSNIKVFDNFQKIIKEIEGFAIELRSFYSWESFCLDKINEFNIILIKIEEEKNKLALKASFDYKRFEERIENFKSEISFFEDTICKNDFLYSYQIFCNLENGIVHFVKHSFIWLKLVCLLKLHIFPKQEKLVNSLKKIKAKNSNYNLQFFLNNFYKNINDIEKNIQNFNVLEAEKLIISMINNLNQQEYQLTNINVLKALFHKVFTFTNEDFTELENNFINFKKFWIEFNKAFFDQKFKESGLNNFFKLISDNRKTIDELFMKDYEIEKHYFFGELLSQLKITLINLNALWEKYHQMEVFFTLEKEKNRNLFLILNHLSVLLAKKENHFLDSLHGNDLKQCFETFVDFEKDSLSNSGQKKDLIVTLNNFQKNLLNLKSNVKQSILLKNLSEILFIKINKKRFEKDYYRNTILNSEILYLKKEYKNVIENLLEILVIKN